MALGIKDRAAVIGMGCSLLYKLAVLPYPSEVE